MERHVGKYDIADRIYKKRKELGLSIKDFAEKAGVSIDQMYRYEEARYFPKIIDFYKISKGLGVTME